jgi:hypothetical protein
MKFFFIKKIRKVFIYTLLFITAPIFSDNFQYNNYNNHGVVGLVNMPTARFFDEGAFGLTIYDGTPEQKITVTASPYDFFTRTFRIKGIVQIKMQTYVDKILKIKALT